MRWFFPARWWSRAPSGRRSAFPFLALHAIAATSTMAALVPLVAGAEGADPAAARDAAGAPAPGAGTGRPTYAALCAQGDAKYAARDFPAALALYRRAVERDPGAPAAHYRVGEAELAAGNVAGAEAAWNRALETSGENDPTMHARALFVLADLKERQWKWNDATAAWQAYADWADRFADAGVFPASARARQQAIAAMLQQDKSYEVVRRRIAESRDGGLPDR